jgi:hypothetical protein
MHAESARFCTLAFSVLGLCSMHAQADGSPEGDAEGAERAPVVSGGQQPGGGHMARTPAQQQVRSCWEGCDVCVLVVMAVV